MEKQWINKGRNLLVSYEYDFDVTGGAFINIWKCSDVETLQNVELTQEEKQEFLESKKAVGSIFIDG